MAVISTKPDSQRRSYQRAQMSEMPASLAVRLEEKKTERLGTRVLGALAVGAVVFLRELRHRPTLPTAEDIMRAGAGHN